MTQTKRPPGVATGVPERVAPHVVRILAPNPTPMTLGGTNSYVVFGAGGRDALLVDPGPEHEAHLDLLVRTARANGAEISATVLTHHHADHSEAAPRIAEMTDAPVLTWDELPDGVELPLEGVGARVLRTPGHTSDSLSVLLPRDGVLLTGDHILGTGTTVVLHPDGHLGTYLDSLELVHQLAHEGAVNRLLPGHGPMVDDPIPWVEHYQSHRFDRLADVRGALADGLREPAEIAARIYPHLDGLRGWAAGKIVEAQLLYVSENPDPEADEHFIPYHGHCTDPTHGHLETGARAAAAEGGGGFHPGH